jgi:hypothetical protein
MNIKTKLVNVKAVKPISGVSKISRGTLRNAVLTYPEIYKCLCAQAIVEEILADGRKVTLTLANYDKDNSNVGVKTYNTANVGVIPTPAKAVETPVAKVEDPKPVKVEEPEPEVVAEAPAETEAEVTDDTTETTSEEIADADPVADEATDETTEAEDTTETATTNNYTTHNRKRHR